ncbi:MAG: biopolymer transporter TolR, partial [Acidobacteriota bacterium]
MRSLTYVLTGLALVVGMVGCGEVDLGEFEAAVDVGAVSLPGSAEFEAKTGRYVMTGSGANMWDTEDQFQFLYRKVSGDFTVSTDLEFISEGGDPHRKAGMMVRESLETDAAYADAIIHGDGLISLQYRRVKGGPTEEIQTPLKAPVRLRLQRDGALFSLSVAPGGGDFQPVGALLLELPSESLLGLAV